jgi:hypothetical protein
MNKELENAVYEYGHIMYKIGRMETDGKESSKEYNKLIKEKEMLVNFFDQHFKTSCKKFN